VTSPLVVALEQVTAGALAFHPSCLRVLNRTVFVRHASVRQSIRGLTLLLKKRVWKIFKSLWSLIAPKQGLSKMLTLPLKMDSMFLVSGTSLNKKNAAIMVVVTVHTN